jgi:two-component system, response regulator FlrC
MHHARFDTRLMFLGESGCGKEACARFVHTHSRRSSETMLAINCAALPANLIEAELFGTSKGAFTEATDRPGVMEAANNSTLLLDEIGEMPVRLQNVLLRMLDHGEITRLGSHKTIQCNTRIFAATNRNLHKAIDHQQFRLDLFYRFDVRLTIPALRDHSEDIPEYAIRILDQTIQKHPDCRARHFSDHALHSLSKSHWSGNMRQLQAIIKNCTLQNLTACINYNDIPWQDCR